MTNENDGDTEKPNLLSLIRDVEETRTFIKGQRVSARYEFYPGCPPGLGKIEKGSLGTVNGEATKQKDRVYEHLLMIPVKWDNGTLGKVSSRLLKRETVKAKCDHVNRWTFTPWGTSTCIVASWCGGKGQCSTTAVEWCRDCGAMRFPPDPKTRWLYPKRSK